MLNICLDMPTPLPRIDKPMEIVTSLLGSLKVGTWFYYQDELFNKMRSGKKRDYCYCIDDGLTYTLDRGTGVEI